MDINTLITYLISPAGQVALIMALAELIKKQELFASKYIFYVDLIFGALLGVGVFWIYQGMHPVLAILAGLGEGLMAAGVFSGIKNLREAYDDPEFVEGNEEDE